MNGYFTVNLKKVSLKQSFQKIQQDSFLILYKGVKKPISESDALVLFNILSLKHHTHLSVSFHLRK